LAPLSFFFVQESVMELAMPVMAVALVWGVWRMYDALRE
jgi:hypothetical protein